MIAFTMAPDGECYCNECGSMVRDQQSHIVWHHRLEDQIDYIASAHARIDDLNLKEVT